MEEHPKISLKAARVNAGLFQAEVARELGINVATLKRYEKGETVPRADVLEKMGKIYGMPAQWLKYGDPDGGKR